MDLNDLRLKACKLETGIVLEVILRFIDKVEKSQESETVKKI